eukprot:TRINITY_DN39505_c0_g1_i1.p1 TRINITY_DN39505_c0_g1~~TRINITY_DN39505_c0_g1_i1.p1  ORF type:complete len:471 (-),score=57.81 TRINITY_DN39505_c0_g1_i1:305-1570(-)
MAPERSPWTSLLVQRRTGASSARAWAALATGMLVWLPCAGAGSEAGGAQKPWSYANQDSWRDLQGTSCSVPAPMLQSPTRVWRETARVAPRSPWPLEELPGGFQRLGPVMWGGEWPLVNVSLASGSGTWMVQLQEPYWRTTRLRLFDEDYFLESFHFHSPSEMWVNGRSFDMETQYIHRSASGKLLVLSVPMEVRLTPEGNRFLAQFWSNVPEDPAEGSSHKYIYGPYSQGAADALPKDRTFFAFQGSLSEPPCTQGVWWVVFENPVSINITQRDMFREALNRTQSDWLRFDAQYDAAANGQVRPWNTDLGMNSRLPQGDLSASQVVIGAMLAPKANIAAWHSESGGSHAWVWLTVGLLSLLLCGGLCLALCAVLADDGSGSEQSSTNAALASISRSSGASSRGLQNASGVEVPLRGADAL